MNKKITIYILFVILISVQTISAQVSATELRVQESDPTVTGIKTNPDQKDTITDKDHKDEIDIRAISTFTDTTKETNADTMTVKNIGSSGNDGVSTHSGDSDNDGITDAAELINTGIEHEDIGSSVTMPSDDAMMSKTELIESISAPDSSARAVFIKFGDIKGEADDRAATDDESGSSAGNIETELKIEKGEKARPSRPKEIVVVGSKVRELESGISEALVTTAPRAEKVQDENDLALFAVGIANTDENVEEIALNFEEVKVTYTQQAKLLGFISVRLTSVYTAHAGEEIDTDEYGRIKVQMPWWHVFARKSLRQSDLQADYDEALGGNATLANIDPQNSSQRSARTLHTLSTILKARHDTAMNSVRNLK